MAKKKKSGGGKQSTAKFLFKLGASLVGGAVVGEIISPLTGPVSGPAIGVALVGLPVWGLKRQYVTHAIAPAVALQALKTASTSGPVVVAKASLAGATAALKAGSGESDELARARAIARSR